MRARCEVSLEVQGVYLLSARSSAPSMQGVRWVTNLRARSSAQTVQGVRVEQMTTAVTSQLYIRLDESLSAKILVRLLVVHVPVRVLALLVSLTLPLPNLARVQRLLQRERIRNRGHLRFKWKWKMENGNLVFTVADPVFLVVRLRACVRRSRAGQVTGFLGPNACASRESVPSAVCPSTPSAIAKTRENQKKCQKRIAKRNENAPQRKPSCWVRSGTASRADA